LKGSTESTVSKLTNKYLKSDLVQGKELFLIKQLFFVSPAKRANPIQGKNKMAIQ